MLVQGFLNEHRQLIQFHLILLLPCLPTCINAAALNKT